MLAAKEAVSKAFTDILLQHKISGAKAGDQLGVSRQSFSSYKRGLTSPNRHVIDRAIELWGPIMAEHGFSKKTSESEDRVSPPIQLKLFSEELKGSNVAVRVESKSLSHVELAVTIRVA
jgi:hypothetical protein